MALFDLNRDPSPRELRWFAGLWLPAFCVLMGASAWRKLHDPLVAICLWSLAGLIAGVGLYVPRAIRPIYTGLIRITYPLGWALSHVLLFILYFLVITPVGALVRIFHDPMARRFDRTAKSYWMPRETRSKKTYLQQL